MKEEDPDEEEHRQLKREAVTKKKGDVAEHFVEEVGHRRSLSAVFFFR